MAQFPVLANTIIVLCCISCAGAATTSIAADAAVAAPAAAPISMMDVLSPTFDEWLLFHNAGEVGIIVRLPGATKDTRLKLGQSPALMGRLQLGAAIGEAVVDESELLELPLHGLAGQEEEDNESASGTDTDSSSERDKDLYRVYVTIQKGAEGHQLVVLVRVDAGIVTAADSVPVNIIPLPLGNVSPERTLHMSRWYDVFEAQSRHIIPRYRQRALQPAPLSLESMPRFVGPWLHQEAATQYATDGRKALVVTFVGAGASDNVKAIMGHLFPDWQEQEQEQQEPSKSTRFTLMLCVYDGSDFSWAAVHPNVILVSVRGQMRFWYLKRFVHPDMVPRLVYDYVVVLDEDVVLTPDTFDMRHFLQLLGDHRVDLAQPAHTHTDGRIERMLQARPGVVGVWTNFVETGPLVAISSRVWRCVWELLQPDLVSGYGYDLLWSPACAWNATAVIHKFSIGHSDTKSASGSISKPNFSRRAMAEAVLLFDRASTRGIRQIKPAELGEMQKS